MSMLEGAAWHNPFFVCRENKNKFVLAFLHSLVDLRIFDEITMDFLLPGHTGICSLFSCDGSLLLIFVPGNQVDQCFSILTSQFKSEIRTVEELFEKIANSPICPKAEVYHLLFIWDWRAFADQHFTDQKLANHSHYHSFQLKREGDRVALRAKKYPQDKEWSPDPPIKLLKDNIIYDAVQVAPFRAEDLNLEKVQSDLRSRYFPLFSSQERKVIESSWERLCTKLIQMPKKVLPTMKLTDLVKQVPVVSEFQCPNYLLDHVQQPPPPKLIGEFFPPTDAEEMEFKDDVRQGLDVVLWTLSKKSRPWIGRVHKVLNQEDFQIHWYERMPPTSNTFVASKQADGSPYLSKQSMNCVMFWQMARNVTEDAFEISEYDMKRISHEYKAHDECYV